MSRYLMTIEYDGAPFNGWQAQDGKYTIEGEIEKAIESVTGEAVTIYGSGRTDAGVSAYAQTAHFDLVGNIDAEKLPRALNYYLPEEIAVKSVQRVADDFHARYDVKVKTYLYKIYNSRNRSAIRRHSHMFTSYELDIDKMRRAAEDLIGVHDFKGMMTLGSSVKTTVREIYDVRIEKDGEEILIYVSGSGFLYNMVRIIVGTLIDIGRGKKDVDTIEKIVEQGDTTLKGAVAPANGLYLYSVKY